MMNNKHARSQTGVSLIEALVALAVMAFGMLGMVGMQATLRSNSDVSKQRAEAVRIGQGSLEGTRAFENLDASAAVDFADIAAGVAVVPGTNAAFTVTTTVSPTAAAALPASAPQFVTVAVNVGWTDRAAQNHAVNLISTIAGIAPVLAGSLGLPNDRAATQRPRGRNRSIPLSAVDQGSGTSVFTPPGGGGVTWVFNNTTGFITSVCTPLNPCVATNLFLLSGFVRFATGNLPTPAEAEQPTDLPDSVGVEVVMTSPANSTEPCLTQPVGNAVAYFCALPISAQTSTWSGRSRVTGLPLTLAMADATIGRYKICRYTPVGGCHPAVGDTIWGAAGATASCTGAAPTPSRSMTNADHPLDYANVATPLTQQNFLVISAGDATGTTAYSCPGDGPLPFVNSTTFPHQPSS